MEAMPDAPVDFDNCFENAISEEVLVGAEIVSGAPKPIEIDLSKSVNGEVWREEASQYATTISALRPGFNPGLITSQQVWQNHVENGMSHILKTRPPVLRKEKRLMPAFAPKPAAKKPRVFLHKTMSHQEVQEHLESERVDGKKVKLNGTELKHKTGYSKSSLYRMASASRKGAILPKVGVTRVCT